MIKILSLITRVTILRVTIIIIIINENGNDNNNIDRINNNYSDQHYIPYQYVNNFEIAIKRNEDLIKKNVNYHKTTDINFLNFDYRTIFLRSSFRYKEFITSVNRRIIITFMPSYVMNIFRIISAMVKIINASSHNDFGIYK